MERAKVLRELGRKVEKMEKLGQQDLLLEVHKVVPNENLRAIDSNIQTERLNLEVAASFWS